MTLDKSKLRAAAEAATRGPWEIWTSNSVRRITGADGRDGGVLSAVAHLRTGTADLHGHNRENDLAYIAAASPDVVLALLDEIENDTCARHAGQAHGKEAEELRSGIESILADPPGGDNISNNEWRRELLKLLDRVDARDSLAYLEDSDRLTADVERLTRERDEARAERDRCTGHLAHDEFTACPVHDRGGRP